MFEDVFGQDWDKQGTQWIINGKDIVNETKDVDMTVEFEQKTFCQYLKEGYEFPEVNYNHSLSEEAMMADSRGQLIIPSI